jgi:hypothetical protein
LVFLSYLLPGWPLDCVAPRPAEKASSLRHVAVADFQLVFRLLALLVRWNTASGQVGCQPLPEADGDKTAATSGPPAPDSAGGARGPSLPAGLLAAPAQVDTGAHGTNGRGWSWSLEVGTAGGPVGGARGPPGESCPSWRTAQSCFPALFKSNKSPIILFYVQYRALQWEQIIFLENKTFVIYICVLSFVLNLNAII